MTEKDFAFGTEDLESAEYLLSMVGGIAGLMETTGKGCVDNTESVPWSAMAINYLLDEAQECIQKGKATMERRKDYMKLTKLDAIALDGVLRSAFEGIVARERARAAGKP